MIGGCSAHNGCTVSWGHRADYDGWGLPGWEAATLAAALRGGVAADARAHVPDEDEWSPLHRAFIDAGVALGLPLEDRLQTLDVGPSVCAEPSNSPDGIRWNAAFAYLDPVRNEPGLAIAGRRPRRSSRWSRAAGRSACERSVRDGVAEVRADRVVLAGGTYGSPAILLRSGIGPADDLATLGIDVVGDLPGVGRNLHDHPSYELVLEPNDELRGADGRVRGERDVRSRTSWGSRAW